MTDAAGPAGKTSLGVGGILSDSFSIFFGNFVKVMLLGFVGSIFGIIVNSALLGFDVAIGVGDPDITNPNAITIGIIISMLINIVVYGLVTALLILLAYDAKLGRSGSMGAYFQKALPAIVPIAILSIIIFIAMAIGAIALIIGMLWVYAVFYVMAPVAVIEKGGFGSLRRSAELTKEYRWPIVGLVIVMGIISFVVQFVATFLVGAIMSATGMIGAGILFGLVSAFGYAIAGIAIALTYARLREIKEGVEVDQIAAVFD